MSSIKLKRLEQIPNSLFSIAAVSFSYPVQIDNVLYIQMGRYLSPGVLKYDRMSN